jgi:hypothetical protein
LCSNPVGPHATRADVIAVLFHGAPSDRCLRIVALPPLPPLLPSTSDARPCNVNQELLHDNEPRVRCLAWETLLWNCGIRFDPRASEGELERLSGLLWDSSGRVSSSRPDIRRRVRGRRVELSEELSRDEALGGFMTDAARAAVREEERPYSAGRR